MFFILCRNEADQNKRACGESLILSVCRDRNLFFDISASAGQIIAGNMAVTGDLILRAVRIKAGVAKDDPFEKGKKDTQFRAYLQ